MEKSKSTNTAWVGPWAEFLVVNEVDVPQTWGKESEEQTLNSDEGTLSNTRDPSLKSGVNTTVLPESREANKLEPRQIHLLSAVQVELIVQLGQISLSLTELLDLSVGARLKLDLAQNLPVSLAIDSSVVADGQIIYENGKAMVEILNVR